MNIQGAQALEQSLQPQQFQQQQSQPQPVSSTTPHMSRIIPVADGFQRGSSGNAQVTSPPVTVAPFTQQPTFQQTFRPIPARPRQRIVAQQPQSVFNRNNVFISKRRGQSNSFSANRQNVFQQPQQSFGGGGQCVDRDPQGRCAQWRQFCTSPSHQQYLTAFCARTCGLCRRH
uniref:ShKT domain-containing protein n=1 Tax=Caenorhabditis tropicalis TaxID=1561998 RepID=A0A1I7UVW3_9PELO